MKNSLIAGALLASLTFPLCAHAQAPIDLPADEVPLAPPMDAPSGYDLFLEARALVKDGPNGSPSATETLAPSEDLRRQRLAVERNAAALARLRAALKAGIAVPFPHDDADFTANFTISTSAREFARQLAQEAAVRAADKNPMGAAQSNLDALRLGAQISRGPLVNSLVGIAISALGRRQLEKYALLLDAAQSREVARQLDEIGGQMQTWTQTLNAEETYILGATRALFAGMKDPQERAGLQARLAGDEVDEFDAGLDALLKLPLAEVEADYRTQFARARARAATPYFAEARAAPIQSDIAYINLNLQMVTSPATRFLLERNTVSNRLLADGLRLRAIKLESRQYPASFDAGIDPFSPTLARLIYKRRGDFAVLYSVGPDGIDNDGAAIQTLETDDETGAKTVSDRVSSDSMGDLVAPVL